jgi:hypothetical protein
MTKNPMNFTMVSSALAPIQAGIFAMLSGIFTWMKV